jgi:hypothetical protein
VIANTNAQKQTQQQIQQTKQPKQPKQPKRITKNNSAKTSQFTNHLQMASPKPKCDPQEMASPL